MGYRVKGTLKLPDGSPASNAEIEFISRKNYSPLVQELKSNILCGLDGAYDVTLEYGEYAVMVYPGGTYPEALGTIVLAADTVAGQDLPTLLQQSGWQPATPEYIQQIGAWLAEANASATSSAASASAAKVSETNAKASENAALSSKNSAASSASTAATKASEAASSASAALASKNAAATSEANALASKNSAATSATTASAGASTATTKASEAVSSAAAAKVSQDAAKVSEVSAADSLSKIGSAIADAEVPYPDVWIPFNNDLHMEAGYGTNKVRIGEDTLTMPEVNNVDFTRASTATYIDKSGVLRTAGINEPRFEKEGLLIEGQSTNMLRHSGVVGGISSGDWYQNNKDNLELVPYKDAKIGDMTMLTATSTASGSRYLVVRPGSSSNTTVGDTITVSFWVHIPVGSRVTHVVVGCTNLSPSITKYPVEEGQFLRLSHTALATKDNDLGNFYVWPYVTTSSFEGVVGEELIGVGCGQLETLPFATSYIPTNGAAATRAADAVSIPKALNNCVEFYSGKDALLPTVGADKITISPVTDKKHIRNVRGFFSPLTSSQKAALK